MSRKDDALKLALEIALEKEYLLRKTGQSHVIEPVITAIREALAEQPAQQQEPVVQRPYAYEYGVDNGDGTYSVKIDRGPLIYTGVQYEYCAPRNPHPDHPVTPLYTSPQPSKQWVGLTDEERDSITRSIQGGYGSDTKVARAIEAKLREKNA